MVEDAPRRQPRDQIPQLLRSLRAQARVHDEALGLEEMELLAARGLRDLTRLPQAVLDHLEDVMAEMIEILVVARVDHSESFREGSIVELAARPEGEVVAVLGVVE